MPMVAFSVEAQEKEGALTMHLISNSQHEQIEKLAYQLWEARGRPLGSPDEDWFRAEQEFFHAPSRIPFSSLMMEPLE